VASPFALRVDLRDFRRGLDDMAKRQLPFAAALALTETARAVAEAESAALPEVFDRPTPFTGRAFGVIGARKSNLTAMVFAKDIQAAYLAPYETGGVQVLGNKRAVLTPVDAKTNAYGNLSRGQLAKLKARPDVFVGAVKLKDGRTLNGVWQRSAPVKGLRGANRTGHLKLLIAFTNPKPIAPRFDYQARAAATVARVFPPALRRALVRAQATAR